MKKIVFALLVLAFFSCNNKEVLLPLADRTILDSVHDHSPVYIFFNTNATDTIAEVNRKNTIGTTNWIFNIDKRLTLGLVVPELIKLQEKKKNGMHTNDKAQNYFSYSDSIKKKLAFIPFTNVKYKLEKPKTGVIVYFTKNNNILVDNIEVKKDSLRNYLNGLPQDKPNKIIFCFDKKITFDDYIKNKIFIPNLKLPSLSLISVHEEYIF